MRARDVGIEVGTGEPGLHNAITDVAGVRVGYATLVSGSGEMVVGQGPVRTGVTVVLPHGGRASTEPVFAGYHRLNGFGEPTDLEWLHESGMLTSPIALTNTNSVGIVRDTIIAREVALPGRLPIMLPVVGETWDGILNDIGGRHVQAEHVHAAFDDAGTGQITEGNVGGGTGVQCYGFKGGTGTAARLVALDGRTYTVGALPYVDAMFAAVIGATAEAILNAMLQAETTVGRDDLVLRALSGAQLAHILDQHGRRRYSVR